ncbi:DNA cytosine methyltransferase [Lactococcus lactis subsp. lactis]|uniref:DNA cytosine methyltransferase n=1 Tax=Lactococcus lactis TaxID=1358 RepID=UPI00223B4552|nr:DNA cytosine methyltransferase [Lactococcus lactis]MCT0016891.1 DNA cytosine methyltransferase [Lactococcus lactis subsp. lactis]
MTITTKKFISSMTLTPEEIREVLYNKIKEENELVEKSITRTDIEQEELILKNLHVDNNKINIVSLFSGAGGLDLGVELAGISVLFGADAAYKAFNNKDQYNKMRNQSLSNFMYSNDLFESANQTYEHNFSNSVTKISKNIQKISKFPKSNLMLGGFPCPGFSAAGPRLLDDPRNFLYIHYIRALMQSQPEFFVAENVKGLITMGKGEVLKQITQDFSASGYEVTTKLVNARDYGVPELRERVFIVGVRKDIANNFDFHYKFPEPTHGTNKLPFVTLKDAIADLPLNPDDVFDSDYSPMYMSRNRKKTWDEQSFTIQASGRQIPQHPAGKPMLKVGTDKWIFQGNFNRRLSVRECARIQTFPDWFIFSDGGKNNVSKNNLLNEKYKQIGNAVPVFLAEKITRPILKFLIENKFDEHKVN